MSYIDENDPRFKAIEQKIISLAKGNMNQKIRVSRNEDRMDSIITALNMLSDNWKERVSYIPFHTLDHYQTSIQVFTLVSDETHTIRSLTAYGADLLNIKRPEWYHKKVFDLFRSSDDSLLKDVFEHLKKYPQRNLMIPLEFSLHTLVQLFNVHIQYCTETKHYYFQFVGVYVHQKPNEIEPSSNKIRQRGYIDQQIQKIYEYISKLEQFTPQTMDTICKEFGINSYTLKKEFKRIYNTSVYKYYMSKRIERAMYLIVHSSAPLKNIAERSGFTSYKTFHSNFIYYYNQSPSELRKRSL